MKKVFFITAIANLILWSIVYFFNTDGFSEDIKKYRISSHNDPYYHIDIYNLPKNKIQVRRINKIVGEEYIIGNYENYSVLVGYCFDKDSMTILLKSKYYNHNCQIECDTFRLDLNDVKIKARTKKPWLDKNLPSGW